MPIIRDLYHPDWPEISRQVRESVNWTCPECKRPCRRDGESREDFEKRIRENHPEWLSDLVNGEKRRWKRFELQAAHDHSNENGIRGDEGVQPLCCCCHLRHDVPYRRANLYRKRELFGQGALLWPPARLPEPVEGHPTQFNPPCSKYKIWQVDRKL